MNKADFIINLQYKTQLLESLGWDEQLLAQLLEYLETEFSNFNLKSPKEIISSVEVHFGEETSQVLSDIFKSQSAMINAFSGGIHDEH